MTAMSKKSRIITRSRYRHANLSRQGKWELREWQEPKNQATSRIYLPRRENTKVTRPTFADRGYPRKKTPPSGQVNALDGVSPQPQDRQRLACLVQAFVIEVHASPRIAHH